MPIRDEERSRYPSNWSEISSRAKESAGWRCQGTSQFPACGAVHGELHPETGSIVVLTTAHLNHDPSDNRPENLAVLCQRCHLGWDRELHLKHAAETWRRKREARERNQLRLFD